MSIGNKRMWAGVLVAALFLMVCAPGTALEESDGLQGLASLNLAPDVVHGVLRDWAGKSDRVVNTGLYSSGEYVFTDDVWDDTGANINRLEQTLKTAPIERNLAFMGMGQTSFDSIIHNGDFRYPDDAKKYGDTGYSGSGAADLVEFRVAVDDSNVYYLVRFDKLVDPASTVVGIGIDADRDAATGGSSWPSGADMDQQLGYEWFITICNSSPTVTDMRKDSWVNYTLSSIGGQLDMNVNESYFEFGVPRAFMDPKGNTWRFYAGSGLWDSANNCWLEEAEPDVPDLFDLLFLPSDTDVFRFNGDRFQADYLRDKDISKCFTDVDFSVLEGAKAVEKPLRTGTMKKLYTSSVRDAYIPPVSLEWVLEFALSDPSTCESLLRPMMPLFDPLMRVFAGMLMGERFFGPTQPYTLYIPSNYTSAKMWPMAVVLHGLGGHEAEYIDCTNITTLAEDRGYVLAFPYGRGQSMYAGDGEKDVLDVMEIMKEEYIIDENRTFITGFSMGGMGTFSVALHYPDIFGAAASHSGGGSMSLLENARNLPLYLTSGDYVLDILMIALLNRLDAIRLSRLGYTYYIHRYSLRVHDWNLVQSVAPQAFEWFEEHPRVYNPEHVTYRTKSREYHRAYWLDAEVAQEGKFGIADVAVDQANNSFFMKADGMAKETVNLDRAGLRTDSQLAFGSDTTGTNAVLLDGAWKGSVRVKMDDKPYYDYDMSGFGLLINIPAGQHVFVVAPSSD